MKTNNLEIRLFLTKNWTSWLKYLLITDDGTFFRPLFLQCLPLQNKRFLTGAPVEWKLWVPCEQTQFNLPIQTLQLVQVVEESAEGPPCFNVQRLVLDKRAIYRVVQCCLFCTRHLQISCMRLVWLLTRNSASHYWYILRCLFCHVAVESCLRAEGGWECHRNRKLWTEGKQPCEC